MKIALAFSGGGYRASAFSLGTLTYLNRVQLGKESLLNNVIALSTVSGGTITGARYAVGIKRGETMEEIYNALYNFFLNADLITGSINRLVSDQDWNNARVKSLINSFADLYNTYLFNHEKFGLLLKEENPIHLKHISFNATEFTTGVQFRFQVSEEVNTEESDMPKKGLIGNYYNNLPEELAKEVRMADILASSSCFPGGFEPINFPQDFVFPYTDNIDKYIKAGKFPIGLMDGGIVDNQGIEPLLLAEKRLKLTDKDCKGCALDLIIISDVSSPYMEEFTASVQQKENWWRSLTLSKIKSISSAILIISAIILAAGIAYNSVVASVLSTITLTLSAFTLILIIKVLKILQKVEIVDPAKLKDLVHVKLLVFESFIKNRVMSLLKLTGSVFMKHIRRLNFRSVYDRDEWKNRRIMNAIYQLRQGEERTEEKFRAGLLSDYLKPSPQVQEVSRVAASMGTTLWFKEGEDGQKMLDSLIACGQFNTCWNLLEYIEKIKKDDSNTNENHKLLISCEPQLKSDWEKFQKDPYWLVREYNEKIR